MLTHNPCTILSTYYTWRCIPAQQQQEQRVESAAYVWDLIQNCLDILGISESEAMGLWSLLAAIYHLGYAGVKKSEPSIFYLEGWSMFQCSEIPLNMGQYYVRSLHCHLMLYIYIYTVPPILF